MKRRLGVLVAALALVAVAACVANAASTPAVVTGSVTSITGTSADLHGTVNPDGSKTTYFFQWGVSTTYGGQSPNHSAGSGTKAVNVGTVPTGLTSGTIYHYRVVAVNGFGASFGRDRMFLTTGHPPAAVVTGPPFLVGHSFAVVTGSINPEGAATNWAFQYGPTIAYGVEASGGSLVASNSLQAVHATLGALASGTTFHYRLIAVHGANVVSFGTDQVFITFPSPRPLPAVHASTTPRRAGSKPYLFKIKGSIVPPAAFPPAWSCNGAVAVRFFLGHHSRALAVAGITPDCKFSTQILFHKLIGNRSTRLRVEVRFRGNSYLGSTSARVQRVHLG